MRRCFRGEVVRSTMTGSGGTQSRGHSVVEVAKQGFTSSQPPIPSLKSNQPNPRSPFLGVGSWELGVEPLSPPRPRFPVLLALREALCAFGLDFLHLSLLLGCEQAQNLVSHPRLQHFHLGAVPLADGGDRVLLRLRQIE